MTSCSENIFNASSWKTNSFISTSVSSNNLHGNGNAWATILYSYENLDVGDYTVHYSSNVTAGVMYYSFDNSTFTYLKPDIYHTLSVKGKLYIRLQVSSKSEVDFTKLMLAKGNVSSFIEYGKQSCSNKLDDMNDKQQKTNDKLDDLNSSLKNSDVDTNGSFFSNFTSRDHGISGIITAPLRAINKLTSACQPVTFSVLDEPIELPCGDTLFWNKEGVQSFRLIWNILVGGPILFLLLKKLFKVVESLKNPDDDRIEVMDL